MRRFLPVAAGFIAVLTLGPWGAAMASEPPDSDVNPQSGAIEIVGSTSPQSNYDIRYVINPGGGDPPAVAFLTSNVADDKRPRVQIEGDGDTWVVWWRSGSTDQVLVRRKDYSSGTWQQERLVSDESESSRNPVIVHDATSSWVAFEFDDGTGLGIAVGIIDEDPDPFPSPATVATTDGEDADTRIYAESGKLWVSWVDSGSDVGWAEYDYTAESWSNPSYESYAQDDVQAARGEDSQHRLGAVMFDPGGINDRAFTYYARLQRVKTYIDQNISEDLSLRAAARVAGLEHKYFSTFFHAKTGVTFKQWVSYQRIRRAQQMMMTSNHSITNVAFAVGFQDVRTFERAFKRVTAKTPIEYKKSVRPA